MPAALKMEILAGGQEAQTESTGLTAIFSLVALAAAYGEDAPGKIVLRGREKGDFMTISTGGGLHRKKLQDILVDMKIPKSQRDRIPLVAIGSEILWILPGEQRRGRHSAAYRVSETAKESIIILEYSE